MVFVYLNWFLQSWEVFLVELQIGLLEVRCFDCWDAEDIALLRHRCWQAWLKHSPQQWSEHCVLKPVFELVLQEFQGFLSLIRMVHQETPERNNVLGCRILSDRMVDNRLGFFKFAKLGESECKMEECLSILAVHGQSLLKQLARLFEHHLPLQVLLALVSVHRICDPCLQKPERLFLRRLEFLGDKEVCSLDTLC